MRRELQMLLISAVSHHIIIEKLMQIIIEKLMGREVELKMLG